MVILRSDSRKCHLFLECPESDS